MGKYIFAGIVLSLCISCTGVLRKDVLDRLVKKRQSSKGRLMISYNIVDVQTVSRKEKLFYITVAAKAGSTIQVVSDTIPVLTTGDGILVDGVTDSGQGSH